MSGRRRSSNGNGRASSNGNGRVPAARPAVITGGAGFVGTNLAHRLLSEGRSVLILDNLSRRGTEENLAWLRGVHGPRAQAKLVDVRDADAVRRAVKPASVVFHLAAQVAVTTSLDDPREDFEVNALGTFNVLEAVRAQREPAPVVFTSTNKVYGGMPDVEVRARGSRCEPVERRWRARGFDEARPLDFHSPYGCSKGAADQYVVDYARIYGLPTVVFRMSCIYGPHQHGTEDQGWVAHFLLAAMRDEPLTIYGDGRQVRDVLFVDDLVNALLLADENPRGLAGRAFNVGGGAANTLSLLELVERIPRLTGVTPEVRFDDPRPGDQPWYVSDTRAFESATGWRATVGVEEGLERLQAWLGQRGSAPVPNPAAQARRA